MTALTNTPVSVTSAPRRSRLRMMAVAAAALLATLAVGVTWQDLASAHSRATTPPPGELVDVGGRDLHLLAAGDGDGPTIVLEAALAGFSAQWAWIQRDLARTHTVVAYDRPGLGWSDPDPQGVSPERIVADLRGALQQRGLHGPYVLVGHSVGGLVARTFADRYAEEVAGVVLVDASHPEQPERPTPGMADAVRLLGRTGVLRATGYVAREAKGLPEETVAYAVPTLNNTRHLDATSREMAAFTELADAAGTDLGATPLTVITAGTQPAGWQTLQKDLTTLSSSSHHVIVDGAGHSSIVTKRHHASRVADEIARLARRVDVTAQR